LLSRAEASHYEETSRYDDVLRFFNELQQRSPLLRQQFFGRTQEGRAMPLLILSDPPISQPREARALAARQKRRLFRDRVIKVNAATVTAVISITSRISPSKLSG